MRSPGAIAVDLWKARILVAQLEREKEEAERAQYERGPLPETGRLVRMGVQLPRECEDL